ncbi:MAG: ABC transporter permease [Actinobacteria bacterium ATB1]|nr:ABC transporter permease [Actinobacteria bacterium ATB1]
MMTGFLFMLRWAWREVRARPLQVLGLALVIALGVGVYAGLSTTSMWRRASYDASFEALGTHDLEVELSEGSFVPAGTLQRATGEAGGIGAIAAAEERLVVPTQVDASTQGETILVPGVLIGLDLAAGVPRVDRLEADAGRVLESRDAGSYVAVVNHLFARHYDLPAEMQIQVSGGVDLDVVGHGFAPQYFIMTEGGLVGGEANYAAVFAPIEVVRDTLGKGDVVNELVIALSPGADPSSVRADVEAALAGALPDVEATVTPVTEEEYYRLLYDDLEGDQQMYNIFALLVLIGAAVGAFNLTRRMVDAQRRQIGTAMALGTPVPTIAARPLMTGVLIAVIGIVAGIGVGFGISAAMGDLIFELQPLPVQQTGVSLAAFLTGAALGMAIPVAAVAWPVLQSVRMRPVDALSPTHLSAARRKSRVPDWLRLPGRSVDRLPLRNLFRSPQRTLLTVLAVAAALTVVVSMGGLLDTFIASLDLGDEAQLAQSPDRLVVELDTFYPIEGPNTPVQSLAENPAVGDLQTGVQTAGELDGPEGFPVLIQFVDPEGKIWQPTVLEGALPESGGGLVLTRKAASDLGVGIGDEVTLLHPFRTGEDSFGMEPTELEVTGYHNGNLRNVVYLSTADVILIDPTLSTAVTNMVMVTPAAGSSPADVQGSVFSQTGVESVLAVATASELQREQFSAFTGVFVVVEGMAFLLVLLIAFNSTSINIDERTREHATMFAFGLPIRTVLRLTISENAVIGLLGTTVGLVLGVVLLGTFLSARITELIPDLAFEVQVSASTIATTFVTGVLVVALAPLLSIRRLRRLNLPSTLRVME